MMSRLVRVSWWAVLACLVLAMEAPTQAKESSYDVRYLNGKIQLAAELLLPENDGPHPGVVIGQGALDSDRTNRWSRKVAEIFRANGYIVLLTDKRGSGHSAGDWRSTSFEQLAGDMIAGFEYLRTRKDIDTSGIGLVGLSQSGRYVPLAAIREPKIAFVVNISGDNLSFLEQSLHEMGNVARQSGFGRTIRQEVIGLNLLAARYLLNGNWADYEKARQKALQGPWKTIAEGFPATRDAPIWNFLRLNSKFDPMAYWPAVSQPVLIMLGEDDEKDNVAVSETMRRFAFAFEQAGKTNYRSVVISAAGHDAGLLSGGKVGEQSRKVLENFIYSLR